MAAGFETLGDDGVAAEFNESLCFGHGGGGTDDDTARLLQAFHQPRLRQAKMEAGHLWSDGDDGSTNLCIERGAIGRRNACRIDAELSIIGREP